MANQKEYKRDREDSTIGKIVVDRDLCIGASSCIPPAPEVFELDDESKAIVLDPNAADDDALMMAAQSCPTKAIILFDKEGKQVFPT